MANITSKSTRITPDFSIGVRKYVEASIEKSRSLWMLEVSQHPGFAPVLSQTTITPIQLREIARWCQQAAEEIASDNAARAQATTREGEG